MHKKETAAPDNWNLWHKNQLNRTFSHNINQAANVFRFGSVQGLSDETQECIHSNTLEFDVRA